MSSSKEITLSIADAGNTTIPCLEAVAAKGYEVTLEFLGDTLGEWNHQSWIAVKDGRQFSATNPVELLGLIAMWEIRGDNWRLKPGEADRFDRLVESAPMFDRDGNVVDR